MFCYLGRIAIVFCVSFFYENVTWHGTRDPGVVLVMRLSLSNLSARLSLHDLDEARRARKPVARGLQGEGEKARGKMHAWGFQLPKAEDRFTSFHVKAILKKFFH